MENMLEYYYCPPGYCQCSKVDDNSEACTSVYYYDDEDDQCVCDREGSLTLLLDGTLCNLGVLCGQCTHDKGVSVLLNKCKSCGYANILLLALLCKCHSSFHRLFDQYFTLLHIVNLIYLCMGAFASNGEYQITVLLVDIYVPNYDT